ncbi:MAG TPA: hypothetical protein VEJ40_07795 [Pseudolabrys sp.]|nr:hypothetical protein [Pseudolabrys sp.]
MGRGEGPWSPAKMSPDLYFALTLIVKMAVTAAFVVAATVTAERAGPVIGGMVATLPIGAGPVYVFLAMDHDPHFIARSAIASLSINAANAALAVVYSQLAQKRPLAVSLSGAFVAWLAFALIIRAVEWNFMMAAALNAIVLSLCVWNVSALRHVRMPAFHARWPDFLLRAAMVSVLVGIVVTFSFQLGPSGSGLLAVFPVVLTSIALVMHPRMGGKASGAVLANAPIGLVGFAFACTMLHFTAEPFGNAIGLALALAMSLGWSVLMMLLHRLPAPELT